MEHKTLGRLEQAAKVYLDFPHREMSQRERLERWNLLLNQRPDRCVNTFVGTEHMDAAERDGIRCADSPISVAFEDPVLRAQGLANDTYGEAKKFFGLTDRQLHRIVCYCHHGLRVAAQGVAHQVRAAYPTAQQDGFLARAWRGFAE